MSYYPLSIAKGDVPGHRVVNKFGFNAATSSTKEGCWAHGGPVNWLAAAAKLKISSSHADDTGAGDGMRTMLIQGLDANYLEIEETVTLTGITDFLTVNTYLRINRMEGSTFGANGTNTGIIAAYLGADTDGVPDVSTTVYATIAAAEGQTLQAFYTVPAGYVAYLMDGAMSSFGTSNVSITGRLEARPFGSGGWNTKEKVVLGRTSVPLYRREGPVPYLPKSDLMMTGESSGADGDFSGEFTLVLVQQ